MAELFNTRWIKQGPHWVKHDSPNSPTQSISENSMEAKVDPLGTNVLLNILKVLRKMDSKMEIQGKRLQILETTNPSSNGGTTLFNDSPISRGQSTRAAASKRTAVVSEDDEETYEYAHSIMKMKWDVDEAVSFVCGEQQVPDAAFITDVNIDDPHEVNKVTGTWADRVSRPPDVDLYSVSMYTRDLLGSRMSLGLPLQTGETLSQPLRNPPSPPSAQSVFDDMQIIEAEEELKNSGYYDKLSTETVDIEPVSEIEPRKRISINVHETMTSCSYIKIELSFHAFDSWKQGVLSRIKNESKVRWKEEKQRFNDLRHTYRTKDLVQQIIDKMRSALEREWREENERVKPLQPEGKKGVKILRLRIVISFRNIFHVSREHSKGDIIC
jgi:hypothetical protein